MHKHSCEQTYLGGGSWANSRKYHTDDIVALDYLPDLDLVASGSLGKNPEICVWRAGDMSLVCKFGQGKDTKQASCVRLSKDGRFVFTTCKSMKPKVRAFSAESGALLG